MAVRADALVDEAALSADQKFMLAQAVRSYYGSAQFLVCEGRPLWLLNEGEYRLMNPWTVRSELDLFWRRYSYQDTVRLPNDPAEYPGGIGFTHDMGIVNAFSRPGFSCCEQAGLTGCFSYMTHEQVVNWLCCAAVYAARTGDGGWLRENFGTVEACFESLLNHDHPDPAQQDGIMSLDSSRTQGGAEITTYDSLDVSLGQARNRVYLAGQDEQARLAGDQAERCAGTLTRHMTDEGYIPAVLEAGNTSRIIPAIEGLIYPYFTGCRAALELEGGRFSPYLQALRRHLTTVLESGDCLFAGGGWRRSSTSSNSWLSKVYLCQFVARRILGVTGDSVTAHADAAQAGWLRDARNAYWAWSDQMVSGRAAGSLYYPRGVTAILWLKE